MAQLQIDNEKDGSTPGAAASSDRRRGDRRVGAWKAELETPDGTRIACTMVDVSPGGARLRGEGLLPEGEIVTLFAESFAPRRSRVAWMRRAQAGVTFLGNSPDRKFLPF